MPARLTFAYGDGVTHVMAKSLSGTNRLHTLCGEVHDEEHSRTIAVVGGDDVATCIECVSEESGHHVARGMRDAWCCVPWGPNGPPT